MPIKVSTTGGVLLDVVSLVNGNLRYQTGEARHMFEGLRKASGMGDADVYGFMRDWSNGYVVAKEDSITLAEKPPTPRR